ncbi:alpha/beta hydrolase [Lichenifustis flavocetrariae]|uniref:Alpha/beta hydrolase n=1 Tax=Lichenifustis flavocetrariae TaxID=2949735 RepID=A0AA41YV69_9HYPH|nr:alpha/beta hydrolase [Lichenifustis flavocetrariae]MCW6507498.1 alpha/beta hydrolase [Lichenifustis flavocetrariae]
MIQSTSFEPATLVHLVQRAAPPGARLRLLTLKDGTRLRTARWHPDARVKTRGTVLICTGRGEFIEKYFEVATDLLARGFAVVVFDWRGQGMSSRALRNGRKGHVDDFKQFEADLTAVIEEVLETECPRPFFALAHSMGGAVMLHHARSGGCAFERIVLSAPMIAIHKLPAPDALHHLSRVLALVGLGSAFVPRGDRTAVLENGFDDNVLTSDPVRFADMMAVGRVESRLTIDAPTIAWFRAALDAMVPFAAADFASRIAVPILMVVPGHDRVVSVSAMERFGRQLKGGTCITIPGARHEILMERDELRDQFWAAFDAFIPGSVSPNRTALAESVSAGVGR